MVEIIKKHLAAFSSSSWTDYQTTLTSDAVYEEVPSRQRVVGIDRYVAAAQRWKQAFPDLKGTILRSYHVGDRIICEVEWQGTQSGPFEGMFGTLPPTHRHALVHSNVVFTMRNGKICESRHYFDMLTVVMQLGMTPTLGTSSTSRSPDTARL